MRKRVRRREKKRCKGNEERKKRGKEKGVQARSYFFLA